MFELKLMSGENLADQNTSKSFELIATSWLRFGRYQDGKPYVEFTEPTTGEYTKKDLVGNAYVMRNGKTVSSFAYGRFDMGHGTSKEFLDVNEDKDKEDEDKSVKKDLYQVLFDLGDVRGINNLPINQKPKILQVCSEFKNDPSFQVPLGYVYVSIKKTQTPVKVELQDADRVRFSSQLTNLLPDSLKSKPCDNPIDQHPPLTSDESFYVFKETIYNEYMTLIESTATAE